MNTYYIIRNEQGNGPAEVWERLDEAREYAKKSAQRFDETLYVFQVLAVSRYTPETECELSATTAPESPN